MLEHCLVASALPAPPGCRRQPRKRALFPPKVTKQPLCESQPTRESHGSLAHRCSSPLATPVLGTAASSREAEMASHELPKAGRTNFSLCQPCSLIRGGTLSQLSVLHSPGHTHP